MTTGGGLRALVLPLDVLCLAGLLVCNLAVALVAPGMTTSLASTVLYGICIYRMFITVPATMALLLSVIMGHISTLVSLNAIESGAFMHEMGRQGAASSASASFVILATLFLVTCAAVFHALQTRWPAPGRQAIGDLVYFGTIAIGGFVVVYLILAGLRTGFPLLSGTDRFAYRRAADILTLNFLNLKLIFAVMLGCGSMFAPRRGLRIAHHLLFAGYVLVSFLYGDKFFAVLSAACFYVIPFLLRDPTRATREIRRLAPAAVVLGACVMAVTFFIYSRYGEMSIDATLQRIGNRVAGQGQLWFLAVEDSSRWVAFDTRAVLLNLQNLVANPVADFAFQHRLAAFYFVEKYPPTAMYVSFLNNGGIVTPTMVFEGYNLVMFGYVGLIVSLLGMGCVMGGLVYWFARAVATGNPFNALLPTFFISNAMTLMAQGTLYSLLSVSAFKGYAAFLALQLGVGLVARVREPFAGPASRGYRSEHAR